MRFAMFGVVLGMSACLPSTFPADPVERDAAVEDRPDASPSMLPKAGQSGRDAGMRDAEVPLPRAGRGGAGGAAAGRGGAGNAGSAPRAGAGGEAARDAGPQPPIDAGPPDAGPPDPAPDASVPDTTPPPPDAGPRDAGSPCGDTSSSAENCGSCGNDCSAQSALAMCMESRCVRACVAGRSDCNQDLVFGKDGNGCETDSASDADNCNGCRLRCDIPAGGIASCEASSCIAYTAQLDRGQTSTFDVRGNPMGGGELLEQLCHNDEVLVGMASKSISQTLLSMAVLCSHVSLTGTSAEPRFVLDPPRQALVVGTMATPEELAVVQCPAGSAVRGVSGATWHYTYPGSMGEPLDYLIVQRLVLQCARLGLDASGAVSLEDNNALGVGPGLDNEGAEAFDDRCGGGQVSVGFTGRSGLYIDGLRTQCAHLRLERKGTTSRPRASAEP